MAVSFCLFVLGVVLQVFDYIIYTRHSGWEFLCLSACCFYPGSLLFSTSGFTFSLLLLLLLDTSLNSFTVILACLLPFGALSGAFRLSLAAFAALPYFLGQIELFSDSLSNDLSLIHNFGNFAL